jgi:hypothetical protein
MVVGGFTYAFNSLFEMPPGRTADAAPAVNKAFNSLFLVFGFCVFLSFCVGGVC